MRWKRNYVRKGCECCTLAAIVLVCSVPEACRLDTLNLTVENKGPSGETRTSAGTVEGW